MKEGDYVLFYDDAYKKWRCKAITKVARKYIYLEGELNPWYKDSLYEKAEWNASKGYRTLQELFEGTLKVNLSNAIVLKLTNNRYYGHPRGVITLDMLSQAALALGVFYKAVEKTMDWLKPVQESLPEIEGVTTLDIRSLIDKYRGDDGTNTEDSQ